MSLPVKYSGGAVGTVHHGDLPGVRHGGNRFRLQFGAGAFFGESAPDMEHVARHQRPPGVPAEPAENEGRAAPI
jgi:hypothetical protein